jgi:hypothetical protein
MDKQSSLFCFVLDALAKKASALIPGMFYRACLKEPTHVSTLGYWPYS